MPSAGCWTHLSSSAPSGIAVRHRRGEWIEETCVVNRGNEQVRVSIDINAFASEIWKRTLQDKRRPGMLARRHLEVCAFSHLAAELRSGTSPWPARTPTPTCTPR